MVSSNNLHANEKGVSLQRSLNTAFNAGFTQVLCSLQVSVQQREPAKIRVNLGFMRSQKALSPAQVLSPISAQIYIWCISHIIYHSHKIWVTALKWSNRSVRWSTCSLKKGFHSLQTLLQRKLNASHEIRFYFKKNHNISKWIKIFKELHHSIHNAFHRLLKAPASPDQRTALPLTPPTH